jgi:hypothetical protein
MARHEGFEQQQAAQERRNMLVLPAKLSAIVLVLQCVVGSGQMK